MKSSIIIGIGVFLFVVLLGYIAACAYLQNHQENTIQEELFDDLDREWIPEESISIVFLAPVRSAMKGLPYFQTNLKKIKRSYPNTRIVFLENDSADETLSYIQQEFDFLEKIIVHPDKRETNLVSTGRSVGRVARMARIRNQLLNHVRETDDLVIPVDSDWPVNWKMDDFHRAITYLRENASVNAVIPLLLIREGFFPFLWSYFDTFAFSSDQFANPDQWKEKLQLKYFDWSKQTEPIDVNSAFGSFGIYKRPDSAIRYKIPDDTEKETSNTLCEHKSFNEQIQGIQLLPWFRIRAGRFT